MKMKKTRAAVFTVFFCAALAANMFAAGGSQNRGAGGALPVVEVYTYMGLKGLQENTYWSRIVEEDLGMKVEITQYTPDQLMTTMASGNIPADIFCVQQYNYVNNAIQAGLLYNLDDAKARLPNLYANFAASLAYYRDNVNGGANGAYAFATMVTKTPPTVGTLNWGPYTRWDYYRELGYPEIAEVEDYLEVLKKMQDAHPVNADGQRQYGLIGFTDWDSLYASVPFYLGLALNGQQGIGFLEVDGISPAAGTILDDASAYRRGVKLLFRANQMGILDPASVSQTYSEYNAKMNAGRGFFSPWSWSFGAFNTPENNAQGIGYRLVPFKNQKIVNTGVNYIGETWSWSIVKNSKNLDKALAFTDYWASYDGMWNLWNGRQGERWDLDAGGEPYYTKLGWDIKTNAIQVNNMETYGGGWNGAQPLDSRVVHPGYKRQFNGNDWIQKPEITGSTVSAIQADWQRVMGASNDIELFNNRNIVVNADLAPLPPVPDSIQSVNTRVGQVIATMSWQAILAGNEAEFETIWRNMVTEARGRGFDQSVQWYKDAWAQALAAGSRYMY